jgi:thiol-disulfide isomerase/thioredoxin
MKHFFAFGAATQEDVKRLPIPLKEGEKAFITSSNNPVRIQYGVSFAVVEPADNARPWVLYADLDRDGAFTPAERFVFSKADYPRIMTRDEQYREKHKLFDRGSPVQNVLVHIPLPAGSFFKSYPLRIWVDPDYAKARGEEDGELFGETPGRMLFDDLGVVAQGVVNFSGRKTLVYYNVDEKTGKVRASGLSRFGIDCDGDSKIDMTPGSSEWRVASGGEPLVFRVGDRYVSTKEVSDTGRIVLRQHAASEYTALEWRALEDFPDFSFSDLSGRKRKFSEFRGKWVLLDFWGTWCGPCVAEIPNLKEAYEKYHERGFEIIGMNSEDPVERLRSFVAK